MAKPLPPTEELRAVYNYDPDTGLITRKDAGLRAFASTSRGYLHGWHGSGIIRAHRVAWKMGHGTEPAVIDHINGNKADNRLANLRDGTGGVNQRNMRCFKNNAIGITGVHKRPDRNSWRALIYVEGRKIELGCFKSLEDAVAARTAAEKRYGFSERHGT